MGSHGLGDDSVAWRACALRDNQVCELDLGFCLLPTKCVLADFEYGYFLATVGILCRRSDNGIYLDLLVGRVHLPWNIASRICHLPIRHDSR